MKQEEKGKKGENRRLRVLLPAIGIPAAVVLFSLVFMMFAGGRKMQRMRKMMLGDSAIVVGQDIAMDEITDFYYTVDSSTNPPKYQRYRFFSQEGKKQFLHEKREGTHWPLSEEDVTVSGTRELTDEEWLSFLSCVSGGTVKKRGNSADSGDSGPWLYLYWNGDRSEFQEFTFKSAERRQSFERLCEELKREERKE